jgi:predicted 3-demethylubiquinone-9 3-methyltransferase (glyoxalase superfamily)
MNSPIVPCLWFDDQAEAAADHYVGIFPNSQVQRVVRYGVAGQDIHGHRPGSVMSVEFELDGQSFMGLNGGPLFTFSEAISIVINCESQDEVDHYWDRLCDGGQESQCGWLKDRFGVSWQVVPTIANELLLDPESAAGQRATMAMFGMRKLDIAALKRAYDGT